LLRYTDKTKYSTSAACENRRYFLSNLGRFMFMKTKTKQGLAFLMTLAVFLSLFTGAVNVQALDLNQRYEVSWDYVLTDYDGNSFTWYGGISASSNDFGHSYGNTAHTIHDYTVKRLGLSDDKSSWVYDQDYNYCFCIEPGVPLPNNTEYKGSSDPNHGDKWERMSGQQQDLIKLALAYGYPNRQGLQTSKDANACYAATQLIVWQIALGWRTSPASLNDRSYPMSGHSGTMTEQLTRNPYFKAFYDAILSDMAGHETIPSFMRSSPGNALTYELTQSGGQWRLTLTDANNALSDFYVSDPAGMSVNISGNTLTITSSSPVTSEKIIALRRRMPSTNMTTGFLTWSVPGKESSNQDMVCGVDNDPVPAYLKLKVSTGNLSILKTTQYNGGSVSGFTFEVRDSANALSGTYTTTSAGKIDIPNLQAGWYSVREINLPADFVEPSPNPVSVEVKAGQTASVSFDNIKKRGVITIKKTNANPAMGEYSLAGAVFEIRDQGGALADTVTVAASGTGQSKILSLGVYRVTEKSSPPAGGFVRNTQTFTVALTGAQGTAAIVYAPDVVVPEQPQVARINIVKQNGNPAMGDYDLAGAVFEIRDSAGNLADTVTVDAEGKGQSRDLKLGTGYTVTEKSAPYGFARNKNTYTVDLNYGGEDKTVVYETVTVPERPQTGRIRITKYNQSPGMGDYPLAGAVFEIRNTVTSDLMDTVTTDETGYGVSKELPLTQPGKFEYACREMTAPFGYFLNASVFYPELVYGGQETDVVYTDVTVPQRPQTGRITIEKQDRTTGKTAQGDATLAGAVFEIYAAEDLYRLDGIRIHAKDQLLETLYCGTSTKAQSKELPLGKYYYREKTPPLGYTHNPDNHPFSIEYAGQNVSVVYLDRTLGNKVIEGRISLVKHTDLPDPNINPNDPQIEKPVKATFEIYLKKAGSYADAKPAERDRITTDPETGFAVSKLLPYGVYVVSEMEAEGDVTLVKPFTVFISQEQKTYPFILNDPTFSSLLKVIKVDATTGKQIPAAGISVKIWDVANDKWVEQTVNYPVITKLSVFETAPDGTVVLPEPLPSGDYLLFEQSGCYGYVLTKDPVPFTIHSTQNDPTIAEVLLANRPVMGTITVSKTGQMLTGVQTVNTAFGTMHIPVFGQVPVGGQVFDVVAASDIVTPDGTVRAKKGDMVDTLRIVNGTAVSKQLYLGDYLVIEREAGEPFIQNETQYPVSLVFENENVPVLSSSVSVENARQRVRIGLSKLMERPVGAPDGFNPFAGVVFGLFADEPVRDSTGNTVIPKDGLIALMTVDNNGKSILTGEMPFAKVYIMELKTNPYYQLNTTKYPLDIRYQGEDVAIAGFQVNNGGIAIPNETKRGKIAVIKTGEVLTGAVQTEQDGRELYQTVYGVRGLPGVTFRVYADEDFYDVHGRLVHKKGDLTGTLVTGPDGRAESKPLRLGRYVLEEETPYGFLPSGPVQVTLGFDGELSEIITKTVGIFNERQKAELTLEKVCETPKNAPDGFNPYADILFGLFAREDVRTADGTAVIPAEALLEYITFDESGQAAIKTDLPHGAFFLKELQTAPGYALDETEYPVIFNYDPEGGAVIRLTANGGQSIENRLQRGGIRVIKTFENREFPLEGVPFTITGRTTVGTDIIIQAETDANGEIVLEGLPVGEYAVKELESELTTGYVLSPAESVTVAPDAIAELMIHNILMRGDLRIVKTFESKTTPVQGVKFTVTGKTLAGEDYSAEFETDESGCVFVEGLLAGEYRVLELESELTTGYVLSEEQTAVIAHGQLAELEIHNRLIRGNARLVKTDKATGAVLTGAVFDLYAPDGNLIGSFETDENGELFIEGLPYGHGYKWVESEAPEGYRLEKTEYPFDITEDGATVELEAQNERIPVVPDNPKTGDDSNPGLWIGLAAAALGGLIALIIIGKKKR
jgi:LPXTG-motif cell wall-anchored protein